MYCCKTTTQVAKRTRGFCDYSFFTNKYLLSEENRENCLKLWRRSLYPTKSLIGTGITATAPTANKSKSKYDVGVKVKFSKRRIGNKVDSASGYTLSTATTTENSIDISAAVLIPICVDKNDEISLLYTKRSGKLSRHVRQISFPGGLRDKTDVSYEDCALRETEEEIGLNRKRIHVWGAGNQIILPKRPYITPVIGVIKSFSLNELKLNEHEVEEAFTVSVKELCSKDVTKYTQFRAGYSIPVFLIESRRIWGITALITKIFLECFLPKSVYRHNVEYLKPLKS